MDAWVLTHNLGLIRWHYERVEELISDAADPSDGESVLMASVQRSYNGASAVLQTVGYLSEALWMITDEKPSEWPHNPLDSCRGVLVERFGLNLGGTEWHVLKDAFEIRNCLLHANGRLSLRSQDAERKLREIVDHRSEGLSVRHDHVLVRRPFVFDVLRSAYWLVRETSDVL